MVVPREHEINKYTTAFSKTWYTVVEVKVNGSNILHDYYDCYVCHIGLIITL